jgi:hypothetical protein
MPRRRLVTPLDCDCHTTGGGWAARKMPLAAKNSSGAKNGCNHRPQHSRRM